MILIIKILLQGGKITNNCNKEQIKAVHLKIKIVINNHNINSWINLQEVILSNKMVHTVPNNLAQMPLVWAQSWTTEEITSSQSNSKILTEEQIS